MLSELAYKIKFVGWVSRLGLQQS